MVDFATLQKAVQIKLDEDRAIEVIEAEGPTLEVAIEEAANLLGAPVRNIEYEVVVRKTSIFGLGEDYCSIRAFERPDMRKERIEHEEAVLRVEEEDDGALELIEDRDGEIFIQRREDGIYVKITLPIGSGKNAEYNDAIDTLKKNNILVFKEDVLRDTVKKAESEYVRIGDYANNPANNAAAIIDIVDSEMRAFMTVRPPGPGGCDLSFEDYMSILRQNAVTMGINEPFLIEFADKPLYNQRVCVAIGQKELNGMDAYLEYYFETDRSKVRILTDERTGQVNLKELNLIQNVTQGEKLAKKNDAQEGEDGFTVTGRLLTANSGKDTAIQLGKNVKLAEDGCTIVAEINGQLVFSNGKINVEMVYIVDGSVNLKTGNISFLGNVIVTGNVEEGFSVRAVGSVEVHGTVNRAMIDAGGDLIVNAGITGKEGVIVKAANSVWAKFIENANIDCGDSVMVTDGIVNSNISASNKIICQGKRAAVMGGRLQAGEEINAKQIGSTAGHTETTCEVGYDPKTKHKIEQLSGERDAVQLEFDDHQLNIQTLANIKKQRGSLPEEKERYLVELNDMRTQAAEKIKTLSDEINKLTEQLHAIKTQGKISASAKMLPGVNLCIRDAKDVVRTEYKAVTFMLENGVIRASAYIEPDIAATKKEVK